MEQLIGSIFVGFLCLSWLCYFMYAGAIIAPNMRDYTSDARLLKDYKTKKWCLIIGTCSFVISISSLLYGIFSGILQ